MLRAQPAGSFVSSTPAGPHSRAPPTPAAKHKLFPMVWDVFQGDSPGGGGAARAAFGARWAGPERRKRRQTVRASNRLPRFCKPFPCFLAGSCGAARPCGLPRGMRFPSFPFLVAHVAALRAPAGSDPAGAAWATRVARRGNQFLILTRIWDGITFSRSNEK